MLVNYGKVRQGKAKNYALCFLSFFFGVEIPGKSVKEISTYY